MRHLQVYIETRIDPDRRTAEGTLDISDGLNSYPMVFEASGHDALMRQILSHLCQRFSFLPGINLAFTWGLIGFALGVLAVRIWK